MADFICKSFHGLAVMDVFELGRHGRRGGGGLLGGQCPVHQLDQHKACRIHETGCKAAPKRDQTEAAQSKLSPSGQGRGHAAACSLFEHGSVLGCVAGDVVLAGLGAALGHFGRQQRRAGRHECTYAAPLMAAQGQLRDQISRGGVGLIGDQAIKQLSHTQQAQAHLPQHKHQIN